jgi:hypothetical protein
MLTATRDPFHPGAPAASLPGRDTSSRLTHTFTVLQVVGSLLAIPVGLASAYSIYRANFSVEATCQSLRGNIVTVLDKGVNATTRRMLVRRDVEAFERSCGAVDPDATAAFKALLTADQAVPVSVAAAPAVEIKTKEPMRQADPRPAAPAKQPAAKTNPVAAAAGVPARRDDPVSDALWLDGVRQALLTHAELLATDVVAPTAAPTPQLVPQEAAVLAKASVVAAPAPMPLISPVAPALPPPTTLAPPAARQADADHPVPPSAIPESASSDNAAKPGEQGRSRVRKWIAKIPLVNTVVENAWQ